MRQGYHLRALVIYLALISVIWGGLGRVEIFARSAGQGTSPRVSLFGRAALSYSTDQPAGLPSVSTTTTLAQARMEYRIGRRWDVAGEVRDVTLWQDHLRRDSLGLEWGFWANEEIRIGLGYGFTGSRPLEGEDTATRSGFYPNLTTKMNRILELRRREP